MVININPKQNKKPKTTIPKLEQQTSWEIEHDATIRQVNNILASYQRAGINNLEDILLLERKGIDCLEAERYAKAGFKADIKTMIELYKNGDTNGVWIDRTERLVKAGFSGNKQAMLQLVKTFNEGRDLEYISVYAEAGFKGNLEAVTALYKANINKEQVLLLANLGLHGNYKTMIKVHKLLTKNDISYDVLKTITDNIIEFIEKNGEDVFVALSKEKDIEILFERARKLSEREARNQSSLEARDQSSLFDAIMTYDNILKKCQDNKKAKALDLKAYCYNKLLEEHEKTENYRSTNDIRSKLIMIYESEPEKNNEELVKLYYNRAFDNLKLERYNESISDLKRVLESISDSYSVHYCLGYIYEEMNDYEEAKKNYQKAKKVIDSVNQLDRAILYEEQLFDINSRLGAIEKKINQRT